ncbi:MAG: exodeoxyribonuclease VII large subunit [Anaerolineaceae bacterium]|nr:exodeoxyribonuclease VII large subunit [Anaerolineaceae bacterium]
MGQSTFPIPSVITVKDLTGYLHFVLENDEVLKDIWVRGEVSNYSHSSSGHLYFTLKDQNASIRCAVWRSNASRLGTPLSDGLLVEAHGYVDIYEVGGQIQFYIDGIQTTGDGFLYQAFLLLKSKLEAEGLFDISRKRPLPPFPHSIGIVTSPTGAALQDILTVLQRRYPLAEVILSPTPVQGREAPAMIISALKQVILENPDIILIARGGGSLEDLSAFNDEDVARAIASSPIPVITGIGHETDFTIADFTADIRAPTPTAAAEMAVPHRDDLLSELQESRIKLFRVSRHLLDEYIWQLSDLHNLLLRNSPAIYLQNQADRLNTLSDALVKACQYALSIKSLNLKQTYGRLTALSPQATLNRGFALVTDQKQSRLITKTQDATNKLPINIRVSNGSFQATVIQE